MHINEDAGIFYDMIFYNIFYFNRKTIETDYQNNGFNIETSFSYYDDLRRAKTKLDPPDCLYPFFFLYNHNTCVLSEFFHSNFDLFEDTIDSFIHKVTHTLTFKYFVFSYYLSDFKDIVSIDDIHRRNGESIGHALALLSKRVDIEHFTFMFYHFSALVQKLIAYLNQLRIPIESLHNRQKEETRHVIQEFISEDNQAIVRRCNPDKMRDLGKFEAQTYSVCYLHKYLIMRTYNSTIHRYAFLIGCDVCSVLRHLQAVNYDFMSATSVLISLGHEVKLDILHELRFRDMTISQLSRKLNLARTSISRYVEDLSSELVIIRIKKKGAEVYYRINPSYFRRAKPLLNEYLDTLLVETER